MANWARQRRQNHQTGHGQCADFASKSMLVRMDFGSDQAETIVPLRLAT